MRILMVYDHLDVGGAQTHGLGLSKCLLAAGHEVIVASGGGTRAPDYVAAGVHHWDWPASQRANIPGLFKALRAAGQVLRRWQPDVIHAQAVLPGLLFAIAERQRAGRQRRPVVFSPQRSWDSVYRFRGGGGLSRVFYRLLRLYADEVIATGAGYYDEFVQHGIPREHCHLIPNSIDIYEFDGVDDPASESMHESAPIVGTVGRLVDQKRMDLFIDAAALVAQHSPDVRFMIVGDGPLRHACEMQIAGIQLGDRFTLLGERSDIPQLLLKMTVFVSASRWEGLPHALLEALAARRAVVATHVLGSSELIHDGEHGLLVPPNDAQAMSKAILKLLHDRELAQSLGLAGRCLVETRYSLQAMATQVFAVYESTLTHSMRRAK